jgi:hypothetical protein
MQLKVVDFIGFLQQFFHLNLVMVQEVIYLVEEKLQLKRLVNIQLYIKL